MMNPSLHNLSHRREFFASLPKVDLHRHLEGSLRLHSLVEIARSQGMSLGDTNHLRTLVQVQEQEGYSFNNFLSKFKTLRLFYRSPELIGRLAYEAVLDAAADHLRYLELRFTPVALAHAGGFSLGEVMDWVIEGVRRGEQETGLVTRLIASVNRHESVHLAEEVLQQAADRISQGVVGVDLAGNEAEYPGLVFAGVFKEARQAGLHTTCHAGEWNGPENILTAVQVLGAERIGHGIRVLEDPLVTAMARERNVLFEVCVTSNYHSGVISSPDLHPLPRMLNLGLNATLNTDDPSISGIDLTYEYQYACDGLGLTIDRLKALVLAAAAGAFLPQAGRLALQQQLDSEFPLC